MLATLIRCVAAVIGLAFFAAWYAFLMICFGI